MKRSIPIVALLSLSIALLAASASFSIAWYASGASLYVESVKIMADPERSLTIATTAEGEYKPDLCKDDLHPIGLFTPATLACSSTWKGQDHPRLYDMSHNCNFKGDPLLFDASPDGYFQQEVFLKADDDVYAGIDAEATYVLPDEAQNSAYARELTLDEGLQEGTDAFLSRVGEWKARLDEVRNCARISLYVDEQSFIYDPVGSENGDVVYAGTLDNDNDRYFDYFQDPDDHEFYEVCYGELKEGHSRDEIVYSAPLAEDSELVGEPTAFNARHKAGVHRVDMEACKGLLALEPRFVPTDIGKGVAFPMLNFTLDAYQPKRVVVSFYLEGWDLDSVNAVMGASFRINLSFKIIRER